MDRESQKKAYMPPKIEFVEFEPQANLMQCSDPTEPGCDDGYDGVVN